MKGRGKLVIVVGIIIVTATIATQIPVATIRGYHCDFTGSMKSWTQWPLGIKSGSEYEKSSLERFIAERYPEELKHKWVSYQGTRKNIFWTSVMLGHGRPNDLFLFPRPYLDEFVESSPPEKVKEFYEILGRGNEEEIRSRVDQLYSEAEQLMKSKAEQGRAGDPLPASSSLVFWLRSRENLARTGQGFVPRITCL